MPYVMAISFNPIHVSALQIQVAVLTAVHNNIGSQWPPGIPGWWPTSLPIRSCLRSTIRRSEEHTSELQSLMRISYAVFCLKKKKYIITRNPTTYYKH